MQDRVTLLNVPFDRVDMPGAVEAFLALREKPGFHLIVTPNPEIIVRAGKDAEFLNILQQADLSLPDGIGVVIGTRFRKEKIETRVPGFDFTKTVLQTVPGLKVFLLGSAPGVAEEAAAAMQKAMPHLNIVGTHHGYYKPQEEAAVADKIAASGADFILSAMGAPRQEKFLMKYADRFGNAVGVGVGGTLDVWAGRVERAPEWTQKIGMEWLYRALSDPKRFKRLTILPGFLLKAFFSKH